MNVRNRLGYGCSKGFSLPWANAKRATLVLVAGIALLCSSLAQAGAAFFAGTLDNGKFAPDKNAKRLCYPVRYCTITADIDGDTALTTIELAVVGPTAGTAPAVGLVPLPAGADGKQLAAAFPGSRVLDPGEARTLCEEIARAGDSTAVMTLADRPALLIPGISLGDRTNLTFRIAHRIAESGGIARYTCPVPAVSLAKTAFDRLIVNANIKNSRPIRGVFSPTHPAAVERKGPRAVQVRVAEENWRSSGDFELLFAADNDPIGLRLLTFRDLDEDDGYFLLFGCPSGSDKPQDQAPKDVVFVLDTSGSMRGEKLEQASAAVEYCLRRLNAKDRFNIITFGTEARSFRDRAVAGSAAAMKEAKDFIEETVATGRTNIGEAVKRGLAGKAEAGRLRIMILLTDGTPTAGELVPAKILEKLPEMNAGKSRIFVVGVGTDVNAHLLDRLAEDTDGSSEYISPDEDIDVKVAALYDRLSHPVLTDVKLAFGDLKTTSVFPKKLPALFQGNDVMIAGRYRDGGKHTITLSGTLAGEAREYRYPVEFPGKDAQTPGTDFAASIWATRSIGFLLQEIRLHGQNKELIDEVVRLSRKFGIVTEYTAFLAAAGGEVRPGEAHAKASAAFAEAAREESGQWAVAQSKNDKEMQGRVAAGDQMNTFVDGSGKKRSAENVKQVGSRAFYLRDGRWVDADEGTNRTVRTVKLFSKDYFDLVRKDADFRKAQDLGENLTINVGNERIAVER